MSFTDYFTYYMDATQRLRRNRIYHSYEYDLSKEEENKYSTIFIHDAFSVYGFQKGTLPSPAWLRKYGNPNKSYRLVDDSYLDGGNYVNISHAAFSNFPNQKGYKKWIDAQRALRILN